MALDVIYMIFKMAILVWIDNVNLNQSIWVLFIPRESSDFVILICYSKE